MSDQVIEQNMLSKDVAGDRTVEVIAALATNPAVDPAKLPEFISTIYGAFSALNGGSSAPAEPAPVAAERQKPAVPISKSVKDDYIVCLEDGMKLKTLKRHLRTAFGMTPQEYRAKWGLPADYPMTAPGYSAQRRNLALQTGLGRPRAAEPEAPAPRRGGRPRKS